MSDTDPRLAITLDVKAMQDPSSILDWLIKTKCDLFAPVEVTMPNGCKHTLISKRAVTLIIEGCLVTYLNGGPNQLACDLMKEAVEEEGIARRLMVIRDEIRQAILGSPADVTPPGETEEEPAA